MREGPIQDMFNDPDYLLGSKKGSESFKKNSPSDNPLNLEMEGLETSEKETKAQEVQESPDYSQVSRVMDLHSPREKPTRNFDKPLNLEMVDTEKPLTFLNKENKSIFEKISEGGKKVFSKMYETIYKIPVVNRIVGKLEISYNNFWIEGNQAKSKELKNEIDNLNSEGNTLDEQEKNTESIIETLKRENLSGIDTMESKLKGIREQKKNVSDKKSEATSQFESRNKTIDSYTTKRNEVADRLINYYESKLEPFNKKLEEINISKDELDMSFTVAEIKHKDQLEVLNKREEIKKDLEEKLKKMKIMSEDEIAKFQPIKDINKELADGHYAIEKEIAGLEREKNFIESEIEGINNDASIYKDKRKEFEQIKEGKPEKTTLRGEANELEQKTETSEEIFSNSEGEPEQEEGVEKYTASKHISFHNDDMIATYGNKEKAAAYLIDPKDFFKMTKLSADYKLEPNDFKKIFQKYSALKEKSAKKNKK